MREELSLQEKILYPLVISAGAFLLFIVSLSLKNDVKTLAFIAIFSILCFYLHRKEFALWILKIPLIKRKKAGAVSWVMDDILVFAALFLKGTGVAAWIMVISSFSFQVYLLSHYIRKRFMAVGRIKKAKERPVKKNAFPYGQVLFGFTSPFNSALTIIPSGLLYEYVNRGSSLMGSWRNIIAILAMLFCYFGIATLISTITLILRGGLPLKKFSIIWWDYYSELFVSIFMLCPLGVLFALIYQKAPYALFLIAVPLIAMHHALKRFEKIFEESQHFIYTLAATLDARDHYTYGHSDRVARYSRALAAEMELPPHEIDEIERAGRIHDLGKIGIRDAILRKQGKLDEAEYAVMQSHALAVKELFEGRKKLSEKIPVELAYSHHERFDGKGYIFGKKGADIPIGARILSVADTFDALTTDRPYRKGMDPISALDFIREASGTQLDPRIVETFIRLFERGVIRELMEEKTHTS
jgi:HD-GYP domain-containing protein (c-di-GMP phosphodiesterase class II)